MIIVRVFNSFGYFIDGGVNRFYYDMNKPAGYAIVSFEHCGFRNRFLLLLMKLALIFMKMMLL